MLLDVTPAGFAGTAAGRAAAVLYGAVVPDVLRAGRRAGRAAAAPHDRAHYFFARARSIPGAGEARNRTPRAAGRTIPFAMLIATLIIIWYARHGHDQDAITARRTDQPWYASKTAPCFEDMPARLRHTIITARISRGTQANPTPRQIQDVLAAWHAAAA